MDHISLTGWSDNNISARSIFLHQLIVNI